MPTEQLTQMVLDLQRQVEDMRYQLSRKTGLGSADIKGNVINSSVGSSGLANNSVGNAAMADDAIKQAELDYEIATVSISAGNSSGTAGVTSGSQIIGWFPVTNLDRIVKNVSVSGTTLTVDLLSSAAADSTVKVVLLKV